MTVEAPTSESFRATEIGDLPESWSVVELGELFEVQQGKALSQATRFGPLPRRFLRTANVLWGRFDLTKLDQMNFGEQEAERLSLQPNDLLVCEGGEIGRAALWKAPDTGYSFQNHVHRLRARSGRVDPQFVMYWLRAAFLHLGMYGGIGNRTTIPNLSSSRLKRLAVPQPPPGEQRAIAGTLSKLQAAVELQGRIVATLKELRAATMAKLFREGVHGEPVRQTEIGEIPESWSVTRLGDLCCPPGGSIQTGPYGSQLHASAYVAEGIPIINPTHMKDDWIETADIPRVSQLDADRLTRHRLRSGDILFSRRGDVGLHAHISAAEEGWLCGTGCLVVRPEKPKVDSLFLSFYLDSTVPQAYLMDHAVGSIMPNINTRILGSVPVLLPSPEGQREIAEILRGISSSVYIAKVRLECLEKLFATILRLLLTGRLRIPAPLVTNETS